jgi:nucleotide-binding universal stress UspA family protein
LREAFRQARLLSRPLCVVHAWHVPIAAAVGPASGHPGPDLAGVEAVAAEVGRIGSGFPEVAVTTATHHGSASELLRAAAEGAVLLVLGAPGSGLRTLLRGSPAFEAAQHAACPVLIVPGPDSTYWSG